MLIAAIRKSCFRKSVWRRSGQRRDGVAAVEFAIVCPLLFLLLAGVIEFGQAFQIQHVLSTASRRGARQASLESSTSETVSTSVKDFVGDSLGASSADLNVAIAVNGSTNSSLAQAVEGDEIEVSIEVPYSKVAVGFFANLFSSATLESTCVMERE